MKVSDVIAALIEAEDADLTVDVADILKKIDKERRLLLLTVALGVPLSLLKRFYSTQVFSMYKEAAHEFETLFKEYLNV